MFGLIVLFVVIILAHSGWVCYKNPQWFVLLLIRLCKLRSIDNFYYRIEEICDREGFGDVPKIMEMKVVLEVTDAVIVDKIPLYHIEGPGRGHIHTLLLLANKCESIQCAQYKAARMYSNGFALQDESIKECLDFVNAVENRGVAETITLMDITKVVIKMFKGNKEKELAELFIIDRYKYTILESLRLITRNISG